MDDTSGEQRYTRRRPEAAVCGRERRTNERTAERGCAFGDAEHRDRIKTMAMPVEYDEELLDTLTAVGLSAPKHRVEEKP